MTGFAPYQILQAIDTVLAADATLIAMLGEASSAGIVQNPQEYEPAFPYIVYSDVTAQAFDTDDKKGTEAYVTIDTWSQTGDMEESFSLLGRIHTLLHDQQLSVASNDFLYILWDGLSEVLRDNTDGLFTYHGIIRFKIVTREQ